MSETQPNPAEPTEDQPGGNAPPPVPDETEEAAAEPTENQPGGKQ